MSAQELKYTKYLNEQGILPRLLEILEQLVSIDPMPTDPLMEILHALGCPLIPQAQMKALERKVSRAQDELRYLRRVLIELGGHDMLYDSDTDEDEYVGYVGELGAAPLYTGHYSDEDYSTCSRTPTPEQPAYILQASIAMEEKQMKEEEEEEDEAKQRQIPYEEEQPCCSHSTPGSVQEACH